ncbi:MAG: peptidoglycan DD-metalloendopeptidase family protein [Pyrinomonadaceae bacterium]
MNFNAIDNLGNTNAAQTSSQTQQQDAIRRAAVQFESILLMQLTSALNGANNDDDENALFGGDGGSNLAKQMFSEQLATTMADSGGIGLSDLITRQFGLNQPKTANVANKLANVVSAVKDIKTNTGANVSSKNKVTPLINKNAKIEPVTDTFLGDPNDAVIISTFDNEARTEGVDESMRTLELNGKIVNTTRARIVPNKPIIEEGSTISVPADSIISINPTSEKLNYQMPVKGRISSGFGTRFHPIDKVTKFHAGMDIAAPVGTPIGAAAEGIVTFAGWSKGYGNLVVIKHADGKETRYGHTSKMFVKEGDSVVAGQQIAAVGSTGKSTGPHLHFEVRENGQAVNPQKFLSNVLPKQADK